MDPKLEESIAKLDDLLEKYLKLTHEYDQGRRELSNNLASVSNDLPRVYLV
jgi:hypothetical protein